MRILTQHPVEISLSEPAMQYIARYCRIRDETELSDDVNCEIENFINLLVNLIERSGSIPGDFITNNEDLL